MPLQVKKVQLKLKDGNEYKDGDLLFNVDAEAWTRGTRNGQVVDAPVTPDSSYPHAENNAEYYAEQAGSSASAAAQVVLTGNLAPTFNTTTAYSKGDHVIYNGKLYYFTANHAAGAWIGSDVEISTVGDEVTNINGQVGELKTQLDNITNEKIYQAEVYPYYAKTISGIGRTIAENSNYRSTIIPVVDGRHYKIEAIGRVNRNVVYGISDTSWDIGTVLTDLNYEPQINTATDNITIEIIPNGYHFLFIIFAYSTQSEYPYSFVVKVTESTNDGQFSVIGIEVPTYSQFELLVGATNELTDDLEELTEKYNLIFNALKN